MVRVRFRRPSAWARRPSDQRDRAMGRHALWLTVAIVLGAIRWAPADAQTEVDLERDVLPSVVQIAVRIVETEDGRSEEQLVPRGSGAVVAPTGIVLTSAHVLDVDDLVEIAAAKEANFTAQGRDRSVDVVEGQYVLLVGDRDERPVPRYTAEVEVVDEGLDIAVLGISGGSMGQPVDREALHLPYVELGDSDILRRLDRIFVMGYPGIASTAVIDDGTVSTFETETGIAGRAWIVTDAAVSGGSSGGPAVDEAGRVVGITTLAGELECRPGDTNGDGAVDETDLGCVPVGSSLAKLRPINLARSLVAQAAPDFFAGSIQPLPAVTATTTPTTDDVPSPVTAYEDDFDDPENGVLDDGDEDLPFTRGYDDGEYFILLDDPGYRLMGSVFLPDLPVAQSGFSDVWIAVDVRFEGAENDDNIVMGCRSDGDVYSGYRVWIEHGKQQFGLERWQGGKPEVVAQGGDENIRPFATNRVELICIEGTVIVRVNDAEIARYVDPDPFERGQAWIGADWWEPPPNDLGTAVPRGVTEARFDDLAVRTPTWEEISALE